MAKKIYTVDESVNKDVALRVRLSPHIDFELTRIADRWECSRSDLVRMVLLNFINEMNERENTDGVNKRPRYSGVDDEAGYAEIDDEAGCPDYSGFDDDDIEDNYPDIDDDNNLGESLDI